MSTSTLQPPHLAIALPSPHTALTSSTTRPSTSAPDRTMPPPAYLPRKRKLAPHPDPAASSPSEVSASPTPDPGEEDDEEYAPAMSQAGPSKKTRQQGGSTGGGGNKASGGRTMSREAMRKANHSMIERRRREKINAALGDLRDMVPGLGGETKGGEFKLEVLERTVSYMRELRDRIIELEAGSGSSGTASRPRKIPKSDTTGTSASDESPATSPALTKAPRHLPPPRFVRPGPVNSSKTPPSPSLSPDPNETEPETNLPPPYTLSSRASSGSAPTIASLIHTANTSFQEPKIPSRPIPGPQAANPTLYLPFPTPSPTSPFLTYHTSASSSGSSGPPEPSPFLAPLQNMSLFGGAINLDGIDRQDKAKDMRPEEAASLLLAFSSPDTLRPVNGMGTGLTPKMVPVGQTQAGQRERRLTLDSEDFVLDGGTRAASTGVVGGQRNTVIGKTARDILKM